MILRYLKFPAGRRTLLARKGWLLPCLLFTFLITVSCAQSSETKAYPAVIGDIEYDPALDDPGFRVCDVGQVFQYYNFGKGVQFKGEKIKIVEYFATKFKGTEFKGENGYITIRFIVNCEGYTGRFRMQEMDLDFQSKTFSKKLTAQLLSLTQNLNGWTIGMYENQAFDYYQHLTFKIEDGNITEIMP